MESGTRDSRAVDATAPDGDGSARDGVSDGLLADGAREAGGADSAAVDARSPDAPMVPPGVSTLAGGSEPGFVNGPGMTAQFDNPVNVAVGPDGLVYVADHANGAIRRVTAAGAVSTLTQGLGAPFGLAFAADGTLFVTGDDGLLRRIDKSTGLPTTVATGLGLARGVVVNADGSFLISALVTHVIWLVGPDGTTSILAGTSGQAGLVDAAGADARFDQPVDIVALPDGTFAVADLVNSRIRRLTRAGVVSTLAGTSYGFKDGPIAIAQFDGPSGLALDGGGNLYVSDRFTFRIRKISPAGMVSTVAGNGTQGFLDSADPLQAEFYALEGIDLARGGELLYVADGNAAGSGNFHRVRQLNLSN